MNSGGICVISQEKQGFEKTPEKHLCDPKSQHSKAEGGKGLNRRAEHGASMEMVLQA